MNLYAPGELEQLQNDLSYLTQTTEWVENFLAKPHPDLGRAGAVCPFLPRALQINTIRLAVIRTRGLDQSQLEEIVKRYRDFFLELEPREGEVAFYKAIMLVFPDVSAAEASQLIDRVQQKLKPFFVEEGLMIGEFHARNQSPGLHNPDFRPLQSPVPMLAIRFMAESDLPFLERVTDEPQLRIRYLEAYLKRWGTGSRNERKLNEAREALSLAYAQLGSTNAEPVPTSRKCPLAGLFRMLNWVKQKMRNVSFAASQLI